MHKLTSVCLVVLMTMMASACQKPDLDKIEQGLEQKKAKESNSTANQVLPTEALKAIDQTLSGVNKVTEAKEVKFSTVPYVYELPKAMQDACNFNPNNASDNINQETPELPSEIDKTDFCTKIDIGLVKIEPLWIEQIVNKTITGDDNPKLIKFKQAVDDFVAEHLALIDEIKTAAKENGEKFTHAPSYAWIEKPELLMGFNNVAQIVVHSETYLGGAHGVYASNYLIFDMDLQSQIVLEDVLIPHKESEFHELAYVIFKDYLKTEMDIKSPKEIKEYESTWAFELSENFYFGKDGIVLSYAPYQMGSFAQGTIELTVPYDKLGEIIKPQYLPAITHMN